jgi:DNA-binding NtrC family response regulator
VLLDEVGDLPPDIQPKLLRALEDRTIVPVGADAELKVNVRILAATNQDLEKLISEGRFRRDLYERLAQFSLRLPPLHEWRTDIPLLIRCFLEDWNTRYGESKEISEEALRYLLDYPWPGNVRELANSVVAMCAMALRGPIPADLLPAPVLAHFRRERGTPELPLSLPEGGLDLRALLYQTEKRFYQEALQRARGNREKAAALLDLSAPVFRKALRERFPELTGESGENQGDS